MPKLEFSHLSAGDSPLQLVQNEAEDRRFGSNESPRPGANGRCESSARSPSCPWPRNWLSDAYLMRRITSVDFETISYGQASWLAIVVSSLLFGLLHGRWLAGTVAGICYALAARRRGLLCDAVVAHGVTNGMIAIYVLLTGAWQLWS